MRSRPSEPWRFLSDRQLSGGVRSGLLPRGAMRTDPRIMGPRGGFCNGATPGVAMLQPIEGKPLGPGRFVTSVPSGVVLVTIRPVFPFRPPLAWATCHTMPLTLISQPPAAAAKERTLCPSWKDAAQHCISPQGPVTDTTHGPACHANPFQISACSAWVLPDRSLKVSFFRNGRADN